MSFVTDVPSSRSVQSFNRKNVCCPVGMVRVSQPDVSSQKPKPGRSKKTHLRSELTGLFCSIIEFARDLLIEKNQQLADSRPIFCSSKTQNVNPSLPRDRFGRAVKGGDCIGEARAIHM